MKAEHARLLIRRENLIDRKTSKAILSSIVLDEPIDLPDHPQPGLRDKIETLRRQYRAMRDAVPQRQPRNYPFYLMIKERYADFDWRETDNGTIIDYTYKGLKPSLMSLLVDLVPVEAGAGRRGASDPSTDPWRRLPPEAARAVREVFGRVGVVATTREQESLLVSWLLKGMAGEPVTIVSPVCPDYAVEALDDGPPAPGPDGRIMARRHRFTFDDLGTGLGVTASHLFQGLAALHGVLRGTLGIANLTHLIAPGDFEGFSAETLGRLRISEGVFLERVAEQARTIAREAPSPVESRPFTDLCGGKEGWSTLCAGFTERLLEGDLAHLRGLEWVRRTALSRRGLYDRWYGVEDRPDDFYIEIVLRQAAEYAAMGRAIASNASLPNPLVFGADDHKMGRFYNLTDVVPVIYLQRNYE